MVLLDISSKTNVPIVTVNISLESTQNKQYQSTKLPAQRLEEKSYSDYKYVKNISGVEV